MAKKRTNRPAAPASDAQVSPSSLPPGISAIDKTMALRAIDKRRSGERVTREEEAALRRFQKASEVQQRWTYYRTIPQEHWRQMSGRPWKVLREQAEKYDLPFGEAVIDLPRVVLKLHEFLAKYARVLQAARETDGGNEKEPLDLLRLENYKLRRMDREERSQMLLPRGLVHSLLGELAALLRACQEQLEREAGHGVASILGETIDGMEGKIVAFFRDMDTELPDAGEETLSREG